MVLVNPPSSALFQAFQFREMRRMCVNFLRIRLRGPFGWITFAEFSVCGDLKVLTPSLASNASFQLPTLPTKWALPGTGLLSSEGDLVAMPAIGS